MLELSEENEITDKQTRETVYKSLNNVTNILVPLAQINNDFFTSTKHNSEHYNTIGKVLYDLQKVLVLFTESILLFMKRHNIFFFWNVQEKLYLNNFLLKKF